MQWSDGLELVPGAKKYYNRSSRRLIILMMFTHSLYPDNWSEIATAVKLEAKWCCQKCGLQCIPPGEKISEITRRERRVYTLQVHHWNRNPTDNRRGNLVALCSACHLYYHRGGKSNVSPGQLSLW